MAKTHCIRGHLLAETRVANSHDGLARCRLCTNIRQQAFVARNGGKEYSRNQNLKNKYGIDSDLWLSMFTEQGNACAICKTTHTKAWHTDHDHRTGRVRGILCAACNRNLGGYEAILEHEDALAEYLK